MELKVRETQKSDGTTERRTYVDGQLMEIRIRSTEPGTQAPRRHLRDATLAVPGAKVG